MTDSHQHRSDVLQERYGLRIAARLSAGAAELPHDVSERLRVAREQAMARRKVHVAVSSSATAWSGGAATLGSDEDRLTWWGRIASALPLLALAIGLITISVVQDDHIASELAKVDAALLVDDLPPAAYTDPGFLQFIKTAQREAQEN